MIFNCLFNYAFIRVPPENPFPVSSPERFETAWRFVPNTETPLVYLFSPACPTTSEVVAHYRSGKPATKDILSFYVENRCLIVLKMTK